MPIARLFQLVKVSNTEYAREDKEEWRRMAYITWMMHRHTPMDKGGHASWYTWRKDLGLIDPEDEAEEESAAEADIRRGLEIIKKFKGKRFRKVGG